MSSSEIPLEANARITDMDLRKADSAYRAFPSFAEWASRCVVDTVRWNRYTAELAQAKASSPELLPRALEIVKRAAAVDTGAIEGLYETDRGFTFTVATQAAYWEAAMEQKGPKVRALFESQLQAYDYVLDFATARVPIAEAWIRKLHAEICRSQETYHVWTEIGPQEQALPKGEYKHLPNHVMKADGIIHSYAPVDMTPAEMYRFCQEIRGQEFLEAHPALQAAYAHYAFVVIHPFADGNGRVARALASVFTYRSQSVPLMILADSRKEYYTSLEAAGTGDYQQFVDFILERSLDTIQMVNDGLRAAALPSVEEAVADIKRLYKTKGGYTHAEVDAAGFKYIELFQQEFDRQLREVKASAGTEFTYSVEVGRGEYTLVKANSRLPLPKGKRLIINFATQEPAQAHVSLHFGVEVPQDCGVDDDLVIRNLVTGELFETRMTSVIPEPSATLQMRMTIWVQRIIAEALQELFRKAEESLRNRGY